jgi:hypothetical protein
VDYKTTKRSVGELQTILDDYEAQIQAYVQAWEKITGEIVKETGLFIIGENWRKYEKYNQKDL